MSHAVISFHLGIEILITVLTLSAALCFIRLYLGPTIPNRTAAFDSIAIHAVAILALYAIRIDAPSILDVAIVTAVLGFLGTTMMARYLERAAPRYYALHQNGANGRAGTEKKPLPAEKGTERDTERSIERGKQESL
jgi:multisubunit Na+/H+ antiporter MnhF subunit